MVGGTLDGEYPMVYDGDLHSDFPSAFTGLGFNGAMFVGVGFTVAPADTVSVTDVATVSKSLHVGPHDSVLVTDWPS